MCSSGEMMSTLDRIGPVDLLYYGPGRRGRSDAAAHHRDHRRRGARLVVSEPEKFGGVPAKTLDPDAVADAAWALYAKRGQAERVFSVF
jgi:hypothetical protein